MRGDDEDGKQFRSTRAVQQHMLDSQQVHMCYEDNEDEYEDFYDYELMDQDKKALMSAEYGVTASGMELTITDPLSRKTKIIGNREFAHVYRMRIRAEDKRGSTAAVRM